MLKSIYIQNYALIDTLDISFNTGFSVITGETGAGKSIILGAIGLLLGQRADIKAIKNGASKCIVEARFNISSCNMEEFFREQDLEYEPDECIIRRELYATGKSRGFINDSPASLNQMRELGEQLIDVHSQHQNLLLNNEDFQMSVLDIIANDEKEVVKYASLFASYKEVSRKLAETIAKAEKDKEDEDYIRFQLQQLDDAALKDGEQEELENEAEILTHSEDIKSSLYKVCQMMEYDEANTLSAVKDCMQTLQNISEFYTPASDWTERMNSCYIEMKELSHDISAAQEEIDFNPSRLDFVNDKLNSIYSLEQKHHVESVAQLIEITEKYRSQLNEITSLDTTISELKKEKDVIYSNTLKQAAILTAIRKKAAVSVEKKMQELLIPLGMPNVRFAVQITQRDLPDSKGMDNVTFLFSANKNGTLQNVASVASGGEIARVMLSLKAMTAGAVKLPTIIFDEIDTGVSGSIAEKMALIMQKMGESDRQVISITHLPQIAAKGSTHYKVYKEDNETATISHIKMLTSDERIKEIANMLSGSTMTEAAMNNARALLDNKNE